jgi:hypothetical protein
MHEHKAHTAVRMFELLKRELLLLVNTHAYGWMDGWMGEANQRERGWT